MITQITRTKIASLFLNGINVGWISVSYLFSGNKDEVSFLADLYDLKQMPSYDSRLKNAEEDISQHRVRNYDWNNSWVFEDERFNLRRCSDGEYLKFILHIFDPDIRTSNWTYLYEHINQLLREDGIELYEKDIISNESIFDYRKYDPVKRWQPFSIRESIGHDVSAIASLLNKELVLAIAEIIQKHDMPVRTQPDCFDSYWIDSTAIAELKEDLEISEELKELEIKEILVDEISPCKVLDALEFFAGDREPFRAEINDLFEKNKIPLKLLHKELIVIDDSYIPHPMIIGPSNSKVFSACRKSFDSMRARIDRGEYLDAVHYSITAIDSALKDMAKERNIEIRKDSKISDLLNIILKSYGLHPGITQDTLIKDISGSITKIVSSLSNLRNYYSSAHGKSSEEIPVYTKAQINLLADATATVCNYLISVFMSTTMNKKH